MSIEDQRKVHAIAAALCQTSVQLQLGSGHGFTPPCAACLDVLTKRYAPPAPKPPGLSLDYPVDMEAMTQQRMFIPWDATFYAMWRDDKGDIHAIGSGEAEAGMEQVTDLAVHLLSTEAHTHDPAD